MLLNWRPVAPGNLPGPTISTSLTVAETAELARLAEDAEVLEIGSAYGYSACVMALAGAHVTAVDPHAQLASFLPMVANLTAYGVVGAVDILQTDSGIMANLYEQGIRFDLIWVDGDHSTEAVAHDVAWAVKLLRPTGTLACHDYHEDTCPGVAQALDAWKVPPKVIDTMAVYGLGEW